MTANGRIECLLMVYNGVDNEEYLKIVLELLRKMPRYTRIVLFCTSAANRTKAATFLRKNRFANFIEAHEDTSLECRYKCLLLSPYKSDLNPEIDEWVRDHFFVKWDSNTQTAFLEEAGGSAVLSHYLELSGAMNPRVKSTSDFTDLPLVGGNVLLTEHHILVGYEESRRSPCLAILENRIKLLFNTSESNPFHSVIWVGERASGKINPFKSIVLDYFRKYAEWGELDWLERYLTQMFDHIDMFLTVTGVPGKRHKPLLFLARGEVLITLNNSVKEEQKLLEALNNYLDMIEIELSPFFDIQRNPIPVFIDYKSKQKENILIAHPDGFYIGAYNNCLVETTHRTRRVWLPRISIAPKFLLHAEILNQVERRNEQLWKDRGFNIYFIEADFHVSLSLLSALHCLTKELARGSDVARANIYSF